MVPLPLDFSSYLTFIYSVNKLQLYLTFTFSFDLIFTSPVNRTNILLVWILGSTESLAQEFHVGNAAVCACVSEHVGNFSLNAAVCASVSELSNDYGHAT